MPFDRQKSFETAFNGIYEQGVKSLASNNYTCMYRGKNNTKCAVGMLITDEQYHSFDVKTKNGIENSLEQYGSINATHPIWKLLVDDKDYNPGEYFDRNSDTYFLYRLQKMLHDDVKITDKKELITSAKHFAQIFNLNSDFIDERK